MAGSATPTSPQGWRGFTRQALRLALIGLFAVIVAVAGVLLKEHGLLWVKNLDDNLGDWRTAVFSPRAAGTHPKIAVVLVTEETLLDYPARSPIDRGLLADLIGAVDAASPKAIGLDFIFDRRTTQDDTLLEAIHRAHSTIVLGALDKRVDPAFEPTLLPALRAGLDIQEAFLGAAGRPVGHMLFEQDRGRLTLGDQAVRRIARPIAPDRSSFAETLAEAGGSSRPLHNRTIAWLLPPADPAARPFLEFRVKRHRPEDRNSGPATLLEPSWTEALAGRIVLVGAEMVDRDLHVTPLSVGDQKRMPGVLVHAQATAQLLDNRSIRELGQWTTLAVVASVCALSFAIGRRWRGKRAQALYQGIGLGGAWCLSLAAFALGGLLLPSGPMLFAWAAGVVGANRSSVFFRLLGLEE